MRVLRLSGVNMKKNIKVFSAFDVPEVEGYDFRDENCPVVQYFRDEADINNIVYLWSEGRAAPSPARLPARYVDCTQIEDFQHALDVLCDAEEILDSMSPVQRAKFQDDPVAFVEYFSDPANKQEYESLLAGSKAVAFQSDNPSGSDDKQPSLVSENSDCVSS